MYNFSFSNFSGYVLSQNWVVEEILKSFFFILAEACAFFWCFPKQAMDWHWNPSIWRVEAEKIKFYGGLKLVKISNFGKKVDKTADKWSTCHKLWLFCGSEGLYIVISLNWAPQAVQIIQFLTFSFFGVCFEPKLVLEEILTLNFFIVAEADAFLWCFPK